MSRNRPTVRPLKHVVTNHPRWPSEFLERLRTVDSETRAAVDEVLAVVRRRRRSKEPRDL